MKKIIIGLVALSSISAFANSNCVDEVMNQISDIPQVAEAILQQDKAFAIASKYQSISGQVDVAKEQRDQDCGMSRSDQGDGLQTTTLF